MEKVLEGEQEPRIRIVLVGPDCSGKTALAERLRNHYGVWGKGNRKVNGDVEACHAVLDFAVNIIPNAEFILDQWQFPVDIVYESAVNHAQSPVGCLTPILVPYLKKHKVLFIHVTADIDTIAQRYAFRGDELWNLEQILDARRGYLNFMPELGLDYITIDTTYCDEEAAFRKAVHKIEEYYGGINNE